MTQKVISIAARDSRVKQVHNVHAAIHADGIHISLHAKFPGDMTLSAAHSIAESLESQIAAEIPDVARVDTHLEPLESGAELGEDVTSAQPALVSSAIEIAERQPEVRNCHEVLVSRAIDGQLSVLMHCEAAPGISVAETHEAATRIESQVHERWPPVERVTVHFEPASTR